jgi:ferredoxin
MVNGRPQLRPRVVCTYCGECERACPNGAISLSYEIVLGLRDRDDL